jgi:hypothetical protein
MRRERTEAGWKEPTGRRRLEAESGILQGRRSGFRTTCLQLEAPDHPFQLVRLGRKLFGRSGGLFGAGGIRLGHLVDHIGGILYGTRRPDGEIPHFFRDHPEPLTGNAELERVLQDLDGPIGGASKLNEGFAMLETILHGEITLGGCCRKSILSGMPSFPHRI